MAPQANRLSRASTDSGGLNFDRMKASFLTSPKSYRAELKRLHKSSNDGSTGSDLAKTVACFEAKILAALYIKEARYHADLTQRELAKLLGLKSQAYLSQAESINDPMKVPLDFLVRISRITDYPLVFSHPSEVGKKPDEQQRAFDELFSQIPSE